MRGLPIKVKEHLEKAIDSALLAVEIYNKPAVKFKSGGYITLMVIAWTSLFHAIFFNRKTKPFYKLENRRFKRVGGELCYWELATCADKYFKDDSQNPILLNLKLFIPLRNKIEHRSMPELDPTLFAECQSLLLNFDELIEKEFGESYCLRESLSFSLQLFPNRHNLNAAIKSNPKDKKIIDFINAYRSSISPEIQASSKYAFKAYLIQVANHNSKDALPIQFIHFDKLNNPEKEELQKFVTMIKYKSIPTAHSNLYKPTEIVKRVQEGLGNKKVDVLNPFNGKVQKQRDKFTMGTHTICWKKYEVRPENESTSPELTKSQYCIYDKLNKNYGYTLDWVHFLVEKLSDDNEYDSLYK